MTREFYEIIAQTITSITMLRNYIDNDNDGNQANCDNHDNHGNCDKHDNSNIVSYTIVFLLTALHW